MIERDRDREWSGTERGCRRTSMPAINGLGLVISTFRDYGENIEERHDCELCYVRVRLWRIRGEGQQRQQRGTVAVWGGQRGVAVPFRVHIVILAPDAQQSK